MLFDECYRPASLSMDQASRPAASLDHNSLYMVIAPWGPEYSIHPSSCLVKHHVKCTYKRLEKQYYHRALGRRTPPKTMIDISHILPGFVSPGPSWPLTCTGDNTRIAACRPCETVDQKRYPSSLVRGGEFYGVSLCIELHSS